MSEAFEYAVLRAVPRVERGEFVNIGVVLYCQAGDFLQARFHLEDRRLHALDPHLDVDAVADAVDAVGHAVTRPDPALSRRERFGWLTAPRSTVVQAGPVHCGVTDDPAATLERLFRRLVLPPADGGPAPAPGGSGP